LSLKATTEFSVLDHCTFAGDKTAWTQSRIWIKDQVEFLSWYTDDPWTMKERFVQQKGLGRRPRCVEWQPGAAASPFQAIFANDDQGRSWETSYSLGAEELVGAVQRQRHKRWRPDLIVPFWEKEQLRFLMIAVENQDGPDWRFRMDMSAEVYRKESDRQRRLGFFPLCLASYGDGAEVRHVAVWARGRAADTAPAPEPPDKRARADQDANSVSWAVTPVGGLYRDEARALSAILDFRQIVGATSEQLKGWHAKLDPRFRVAHVGSRKGGGPLLFDAVAVQQADPPPSRFHIELAEEAMTQKSKELQEQDSFRPLAICSNPGAGPKPTWQHTALWVKDGQRWAWGYGQVEDIARGNSHCKAESRPIALTGTEHPGGLQCKTVVAPHQGRKWEVLYGVNHDELLPTVEFYRSKGWRPDVVAPYWQGKVLGGMLVVVDNFDKVDWRFRMDMSRADYQGESNRQMRRGLFPLALASYGHGDAVRYAAIFVRYRRPPGE
jgi:hypothetical protein